MASLYKKTARAYLSVRGPAQTLTTPADPAAPAASMLVEPAHPAPSGLLNRTLYLWRDLWHAPRAHEWCGFRRAC
jgi:hypothetical protein